MCSAIDDAIGDLVEVRLRRGRGRIDLDENISHDLILERTLGLTGVTQNEYIRSRHHGRCASGRSGNIGSRSI